MDSARKKELKEAYKEVVTYYGVIKLTNTQNGKVFIGSFTNLKNKESYLRAQLEDGRHPNAALQADWRACGSAAFAYEVLEQKDASKATDPKGEAKQLEDYYLELLQPYGDTGYNKLPKTC
jgi:hypothetical protein